MKRLLLSLLLAAGLLCGCGASSEPASAQIFAMDTVMDLTAYGKGGAAALEETEEIIRELESMLDRTSSESEVSAVNRRAGEPTAISETLAQLLTAARQYSLATGGAFDVTISPVMDAWGFTQETQQVPEQAELEQLLPLVDSSCLAPAKTADGSYSVTLGRDQAIDLGGIAKGYVSDCVEHRFRGWAVESGMVSLGGNVFVRGTKPDGTPWRVGVQSPDDPERLAGILSLTDAYAVTSGGYQRYFEQDGKTYHPIIDPADGCPADSGLISVTVVAPANGAPGAHETVVTPGSGAMCDAFSTALFVMGEEEAVSFWRSGRFAFDLVLITDDGRCLVTAGLEDRFEENKESGYAYEIIR